MSQSVFYLWSGNELYSFDIYDIMVSNPIDKHNALQIPIIDEYKRGYRTNEETF